MARGNSSRSTKSNRGSSKRGFAAMSKEDHLRASRKGGENSHSGGRNSR